VGTANEAAERTLFDVLASVREAAERPLLITSTGDVIESYRSANLRSARLAHALRARGLERAHRLAMQVQKSPEAVLLYLACLRAGVVLLPMNTAYTAAEVEHLVADASPHLFVDERQLASLVAESDALPSDCERFADVEARPDDLAAILYTSGTTGKPKGAQLSHRNLASNAFTLHEIWGFTDTDVLLHALPIFHTHGLFVAINCALLGGIPMVFLDRFEPDAVIAALPRCTVMMGVPTFYTRLLLDHRLQADVCAGMRLFISGSAPLLASTHEEFRERTGHAILERYGMTETSMLTSNPLHGDRRPGTVGIALPGVEVRLAEDGAVEVRGPNVFAGYWGRPELNATEFTADGFFRTGDIGRFDADGYLHLIGRAKDLIISGGLNIYPKEIEAVIDGLPGVAESAVVGVPDPDFGEAVIAVVVPVAGHAIEPDVLRAECRQQLAGFKVPRRVVVVDELPRNAMGKVQKALLRATFSQ
jgi:malonyl-CoA/methylmalonyl-CoA synthetase